MGKFTVVRSSPLDCMFQERPTGFTLPTRPAADLEAAFPGNPELWEIVEQVLTELGPEPEDFDSARRDVIAHYRERLRYSAAMATETPGRLARA